MYPSFLWKAVGSCMLSVSCIFLNLSLIVFCLTEKELRDLKFLPLCIQAATDLIGPGVANFMAEVRGYNMVREVKKTFKFSLIFLLKSSENVFERSMHGSENSYSGCIIIFLRSMLNEYSTGWCIVGTGMRKPFC